jgi:hypothetical protein
VRATKKFTIERAPNVLALQLKRFEFGAFGGKIDKQARKRDAMQTLHETMQKRCMPRNTAHSPPLLPRASVALPPCSADCVHDRA